MAERGITGDVADDIVKKIEGFADFGFPESHSVSFAYSCARARGSSCTIRRSRVRAAERSRWLLRHTPSCATGSVTASVLGLCAGSRRDCTIEPRSEAQDHRRPGRGGTPTRRSTPCVSDCGTCGLSSAPRPHRRRTDRAAVHRSRRLHPSHRCTHRRWRPRHRRRIQCFGRSRRSASGRQVRCATRVDKLPGWSRAPAPHCRA
jgi:hypothetical protein